MFYDIFIPAVVQAALFTRGETVLSGCVGSDPQIVTLAHSYSHVSLETTNSKCQN